MILPKSISLAARRVYYSNCDSYYTNNCNSAWSRWGRWVLAGILLFLAILFIFLALCFRRRRARRNQIFTTSTPMQAQQPGGVYYNQTQPQYEGNYAPPAGAPPNYGGQNEYYGQQNGIAQPQNAYQPYK